MEKQFPNRRGRPKGSRDWRLGLSTSKIEKLRRKLLNMALGGDMRAMQICADRLWPKLRPEALPVQIKTDSGDPAVQGAAIIAAALAGRLSPDVLHDLLGALANQAKLIEFTAIEERLAALENQTSDPLPPWDRFPIRGKRTRTNYEK